MSDKTNDPNPELNVGPIRALTEEEIASLPGQPGNASRRSFMRVGAMAGLAGAGGMLLAGCGRTATPSAAGPSTSESAHPVAAAATSAPEDFVAPGKLDEYYGFWSGGQSGEMRILGLPSMRELMRIPVFNTDFAIGWGITNESKRVLGENFPRGGDLHHPHMSQTHGHYDGRYLFANDKCGTRVARIRCDVMRTDKIINIPNVADIHGMRVQREPRTGYVFANSEFRVPSPNDGRDLDDP
ncbi:MAG: TAT-dependent nitrous-oxide reductase, partial [Rhodanobacter sp.]